MKAIAYQHALPITDPLSLQDVDLPEPTPGARDLLVEVQAIAVNPVDTKMRLRSVPAEGQWAVLGWDAVGTVRAVGAQVTMFKPGDRVWYAGWWTSASLRWRRARCPTPRPPRCR